MATTQHSQRVYWLCRVRKWYNRSSSCNITSSKTGVRLTTAERPRIRRCGKHGGYLNGCAAIITRSYPKAFYMHCSSHCLNLCMYYCYEKLKLVDLCRTRCVSRHHALTTIGTYLCTLWAGQYRQKNLERWCCFICWITIAFDHWLWIYCCLFYHAHPLSWLTTATALTVALQEKAKDIVQAYEHVRKAQETLHKLRDDVDAYQGEWWKEITEMSAKPLLRWIVFLIPRPPVNRFFLLCS